jgi:hypothetical protein
MEKETFAATWLFVQEVNRGNWCAKKEIQELIKFAEEFNKKFTKGEKNEM